MCQVEALCSWRGLEELKKGTAQAQAALEFGDLFATCRVKGCQMSRGQWGEELMIQGNLLLSPQNVYPYYDHAVRQESLIHFLFLLFLS